MSDWKPHLNYQHKTTKSKRLMNSSMMSWTSDQSHIYDTFKKDPTRFMEEYDSDDNFIQDYFIDHYLTTPLSTKKYDYSYIQDLTEHIAVYKHDTKQGAEFDQDKHRIIVFQGHPRPWEQDKIPYR